MRSTRRSASPLATRRTASARPRRCCAYSFSRASSGLEPFFAIKGELSGGSLIACSIILSRALAPIEVAITHRKGFVAMRQSAGRLNHVLGTMPSNRCSRARIAALQIKA